MHIPQADIRPAEILALLLRQVRAARDALAMQEASADDHIHLARKMLKRARASLRLLRSAVGETAYAGGNAALRDAVRPLARARDAQAAIETLDRLLAREKTARGRAALEQLRPRLHKTRADAARELRAAGTMQACAQAVETSLSRLNRQRIRGDDRRMPGAGLKRIYRSGRAALAATTADRSDESLHELRKQAKFLEHALEIFGRAKGAGQKNYRRLAKSVASRLGDDHDLALLHGQIIGLPAAKRGYYAAVLERIAQRRAQLQRKALKQAKAIYEKKARVFAENMTASA